MSHTNESIEAAHRTIDMLQQQHDALQLEYNKLLGEITGHNQELISLQGKMNNYRQRIKNIEGYIAEREGKQDGEEDGEEDGEGEMKELAK